MIKLKARMVAREHTAAEWTSLNPTLLAGEFGYETDTHKLKVGVESNGALVAWNDLPYFYGGAALPSASGGTDGQVLVINNGDWDIGEALTVPITTVTSLPAAPDEGVLYYWTTTGSVYTYLDSTYSQVMLSSDFNVNPTVPASPTALPYLQIGSTVYQLGGLFFSNDTTPGIFTDSTGTNITSDIQAAVLPDVGTSGQIMTNVGGYWTAANPADQLPTLTSTNNGQVLMVVNGEWTAASILEADGVSF